MSTVNQDKVEVLMGDSLSFVCWYATQTNCYKAGVQCDEVPSVVSYVLIFCCVAIYFEVPFKI